MSRPDSYVGVTRSRYWDRATPTYEWESRDYSGFLGNLSVALLRDGERPHPTRPDETVIVWKLVAQERQPRPRSGPLERDLAPGAPCV